ncbi:MAG: glycoside hydrolase family 3 C-terminal domain-containing protein, partial [Lachnospiraceae bacterium]|nr:glycoside hydrolase family 3 C-terminal domain-containing protein [Lachnospiraceae bacterium]
MGNGKKQRAKELPKVRILLLPLIMAVIILSAVFCSEMPVWACVMLGISNGALVYFLFVVLKVQRNIMDKVCSDKTQEILSEQETAACAQRIAEEGIVLLKNEENLLPLPQGAHLNLVGLRCV